MADAAAVFTLSMLLTLKDEASDRVDSFLGKLRELRGEGHGAHKAVAESTKSVGGELKNAQAAAASVGSELKTTGAVAGALQTTLATTGAGGGAALKEVGEAGKSVGRELKTTDTVTGGLKENLTQAGKDGRGALKEVDSSAKTATRALTASGAAASGVKTSLREVGKEGRNVTDLFTQLRGATRDIGIGVVGLATLRMFERGVEKAGDFQSSITDLRLAIEEAGTDGAVNLAKLNNQMARFSALGMNLGNQLPGTTKDFIDMFIALKEGGIQTETILGGAGEAVAHLAVLTHSVPAELAKPYAQLGEQFQLKPEEYAPSADVFLKSYRAVGLRPEDLIEGTKFAQLRGGLPLGLKGLSGMQTMANMLSLLKMMGLEGGIGGREVAGVLMHLSATSKEQKKADEELRRRGINLQFFDKKGSFLGTENAIQQFAKLRQLSPEERLDIGKKRFGSAEALGPITAFAEQGEEGYAKLKARMNAVPPMQDQINEKLNTYNARMEALRGTLDNLKVSVFTPMLEPLSQAADKANTLVGNLQGFAETHPTITNTVLLVGSLGGAALTAYGGLKVLITGWRLWRIASALGSNERGVLSFFTQAKNEAAATGTAMKVAAAETTAAKAVMGEQMQLPWADNMRGTGPVQQQLPFFASATNASKNLGRELEETTAKATGLRNKLVTPIRATVQFAESGYTKVKGAINAIPTDLKVGITFIAAQYALENILQTIDLIVQYEEAKFGRDKANEGNLQTIAKARQEFAKQGQPVPQEIWRGQAQASLAKLNPDNQLKEALGGWTAGAWLKAFFGGMTGAPDAHPYSSGVRFNTNVAAREFQERAPELREPEIMAQMRQMIDSWKLPADQREKVDKALQTAFPDSFTKASQQAAQGLGDVGSASSGATDEIQRIKDEIDRLNNSVRSTQGVLPPAFNSAATAAENFASRVDGINIQTPVPSGPTSLGPHGAPSPTPQSAIGSVVLRSGLVHAHRGNVIIPAALSRRSPGDWLRDFAPRPATVKREVNFNGDINVNLPAGSRAADDPAALAALVRERLVHEMQIAEERA